MAAGNGAPAKRERLRRRVVKLLEEQAECLRKVFRSMGYSEEQNRSSVDFFLLRKAHLLKLVDKKFSKAR